MAKWNFLGRKDESTDDDLVTIDHRGQAIFARFNTRDVGAREAPEISVPLVAALEETEEELKFLVIDGSRVEFLNSTGLGMLVDLHDRVRNRGGEVVLYGLKEHVLQILRTVSVARMFALARTPEELASLLRKSAA